MHAPFEIVWQISPDRAPVVLRAATDANAATIAFGEELARLRGHAAPGEVLVRSAGDQRPLLREALTRGPVEGEEQPREAERHRASISRSLDERIPAEAQ